MGLILPSRRALDHLFPLVSEHFRGERTAWNLWMVSGPKGHPFTPPTSPVPNKNPLRHTRAAAPIASQIFLDGRRCQGPRSGRRSRRPKAVLDSGDRREDPQERVGGPPQPRRRSADKDAENMPVRIGISTQRLITILRPIETQRSPQPEHTIMLSIELRDRANDGVEMHVLDRPRSRPVGWRHLGLVDPVERESPTPVRPGEHQPVVVPRLLVPRPVDEAEELAVELGEAAYVGGVEDGVEELSHAGHPGPGRASGAWRSGRRRTRRRSSTTGHAPPRESGCGR